MPSHFLCNYHRAWLATNPQAALTHLQQCIHSASMLRQTGQWHRALPYIGSAFEAASLLLDSIDIDIQLAATELTSSALLLADNYYRMGRFHHGREIIKQAITLLVETQQRTDVGGSARLSGCISLLHKKLTEFLHMERQRTASGSLFQRAAMVH